MNTVAGFTKPVVTALPQTTLRAVAGLIREHGVGSVVLTQQDCPVGIVTDRDIALAVGEPDFSADDPVRRVMTAPVHTVGESTDAFEAAGRMAALGVRRLPVVDGEERLTGMVSLDDLLARFGKACTDLSSAAVHASDEQNRTCAIHRGLHPVSNG